MAKASIKIFSNKKYRLKLNINKSDHFYRGFTKMSSQGQYEGGGTKTVSMFSKLVSQGSSFVMEGVKNLVVKKHVS